MSALKGLVKIRKDGEPRLSTGSQGKREADGGKREGSWCLVDCDGRGAREVRNGRGAREVRYQCRSE
jgi:hypothetical protein